MKRDRSIVDDCLNLYNSALKLTPFTSEASTARQEVRAPVELHFLSNQPIFCRNIAEKDCNLRRVVSLSPATDNVRI